MDVILIFAAFGASIFFVILARVLYSLYNGFRVHFIGQYVDLKQKFGAWAVVTGCTDGIGKAYANELAKRGINIVLISRNIDRLKSCAAEIENCYGVETKIIAVDLSEGRPAIDKIKEQIDGLTVGILVNNVGAQYTVPAPLDQVPEKELWAIINMNIGVTTMLTKMVVPKMKERGKGAIVNVSSSSENQPWPLFTVYAASKIYIKYLSDAIRVEYQDYGITVQHLAPAFVGTKMNDFSYRVRNKSFCVPDAQQYAHSAVATLGLFNYSTGFWIHGLQGFFTGLAPLFLRVQISCLMNKVFRKDYLEAQHKKVLTVDGKED